jgi:hypothetical protein
MTSRRHWIAPLRQLGLLEDKGQPAPYTPERVMTLRAK